MATIKLNTANLLIIELDGIEALILGNDLRVSSYYCCQCNASLDIHSVYYIAHLNRFCCVNCLQSSLRTVGVLRIEHYNKCLEAYKKLY